MFEEFEFSPLAAGAGLVGGILSLVVMKSSPAGLIFKAFGFIVSCVVCYFVFNKIVMKQ